MKARMRRLSVSVDSAIIRSDSTEDTVRSEGTESSFQERVRKLLSSPLSRRKSASSALPSSGKEGSKLKVFGSPLYTLAHVDQPPPDPGTSHACNKEPGIPYVITRLCNYIERESGLSQEGLFRVSANVRLVERLRNSFDESGDAPLEETGDIAAAAALLKLFLRELPQPVIPCHLNQPFFAAVRDLSQGQSDGRERVKALVAVLPNENFHILKYLCAFLQRVSRKEEFNRMNSSSLGIVFGPNVFRVSPDDYLGLKDQAISGPNQVVSLLISDSDYIFDEDLRKKAGALKLCDLETEAVTSKDRRKSKVKRRGISEGERDSLYQPLNTHIIPLLILNSETLSTSGPLKPPKSPKERKQSRLLGAEGFLLCRSASVERPSYLEQTPVTNEIRRCVSSEGVASFTPESDKEPEKETLSNAPLLNVMEECSSVDCESQDERTETCGQGIQSKKQEEANTDSWKNIDSLPITYTSRHRNSWPRDSNPGIGWMDSNTNAETSRIMHLCSPEAQVSESAFRGYLNRRSQRLSDHDVAPSPPLEQEQVFGDDEMRSLTSVYTVEQRAVRHKIQRLRSVLEEMREEAAESHESEKIKQELLTLRQQFRDLNTDCSEGGRSSHTQTNAEQQRKSLSEALAQAQKELQDRRSHSGRPYELSNMNPEQVADEKCDLQKTLLRFESMYGRPKSKRDRDAMRPLYDRYRTVKRLLNNSPHAPLEPQTSDLVPILEHVILTLSPPASAKKNTDVSSLSTGKSDMEASTVEQKELSQLLSPEQNLHEMSVTELRVLVRKCRTEKKRLKQMIRKSEEAFQQKHGRKVEKSDRPEDFSKVYANYKHLKGKVKLLEALISKSQTHTSLSDGS